MYLKNLPCTYPRYNESKLIEVEEYLYIRVFVLSKILLYTVCGSIIIEEIINNLLFIDENIRINSILNKQRIINAIALSYDLTYINTVENKNYDIYTIDNRKYCTYTYLHHIQSSYKKLKLDKSFNDSFNRFLDKYHLVD